MAGSKALPPKLAKYWAARVEEWADVVFRDQPVNAKGRRWVQKDLAPLFEVAQGQMSAWLRGKSVGPTALMTSSRLTGRTINDLLGLDYPASERERVIFQTKTRALLDLLNANQNFAFQGPIRTLMDELYAMILRSEPAHPTKLFEPKKLRSKFPKFKTEAAPRSRRKIA